ncbi:MAG: hypothetical protein B5M52_06395 [Helicobacteraceae bacterium 4484_230]|nr:MAG: hypothetical protein B5M52_06395 [Helicobacteraceae bacterium 4484_230]
MRYLLVLFSLFFAGCSHFRVNAAMCDRIMSDPNAVNIPEECRAYSEEDAEKASVVEKKGECIECEKPGRLEYRE